MSLRTHEAKVDKLVLFLFLFLLGELFKIIFYDGNKLEFCFSLALSCERVFGREAEERSTKVIQLACAGEEVH